MAEPTAGTQWAIARFRDLYNCTDYHTTTDADGDSCALGISHLLYELQAGKPLALIMATPPAAPKERQAILAAALGADALAAVLDARLRNGIHQRSIRIGGM